MKGIKIQLDEDNLDIKSYPRYTHTYLPLQAALHLSQPDVNILNFDIVSSPSALSKLLHYLEFGRGYHRWDLELRGKTLFISHWVKAKDWIGSVGYGESYRFETCKYGEDLGDSRTHHRVVSYRLDGLNVLVQSQADASYCTCHPSVAAAPRPAKPTSANPFSLLSGLDELSFGDEPCNSSSGDTRASPDENGTHRDNAAADSIRTLSIRHSGRHIPSQCLVELQTRRSNSNAFYPKETRMYFAQRTRLFEAIHLDGKFEGGGEVVDKSDDLQMWQEENQDQLHRLADLLKELASKLKRLSERRDASGKNGLMGVAAASMIGGTGPDDGRGKLGVYWRDDGASMLP